MKSYRDSAFGSRRLVSRSGFWRWEQEPPAQKAQLFGPASASAIVRQWERENRGPTGRVAIALAWLARQAGKVAALAVMFGAGVFLSARPDPTTADVRLQEELRRTEDRLTARQGELALVRMEVDRLNSIIENSRRYSIPADLAASIYDISLSEGIDPRIAFGLVSVESDFLKNAVSHKGAVGLTQVMPATARILDPSIRRADLFDRETNLRLGFRFLREMLHYYKGDLNLALTAYNRGPARVDEIRKKGGDPSNGYAQAVLAGGQD